MKQKLEVAGKNLWDELEESLSKPEEQVAEVFAPDFCDLREELKDPESEPLQEVVQHLRDLGYLASRLDSEENEVALGPKDEKDLAEALQGYYADQDHFEELFSYEVTKGESGEPKNVFRDKVLEERLTKPLVVKFDTIARLRALTSLDGKVDFTREAKIEEKSLLTRVLHHLLRLYGVLPDKFDASSRYDEESLRALRGLRALLGVKADEMPLLEVMNELNDLAQLTGRFANQFQNASVWIRAPEPGNNWDVSVEDQSKAIEQNELPARAVEVSSFEKQRGAAWPPSISGLFGIRFLQIYLWQRGHYLGKIDGLWGSVSQEAFESALVAHDLQAEPLKEWREKKKKGYWVVWGDFYCLDVSAFILACGPLKTPRNAPKSPDDIFDMQTAIDHQLASRGASEAERKNAWSRVFTAAAGDIDQQKAGRRRNFSLGMVGRGIQRVLDAVVRLAMKVKQFIEQLVETVRGAVRQALRYLNRILTPALNTAKLATRRVIRMFTGAPNTYAVSGSRWVVSKFSFDRDVVTVGSHVLLSEDAGTHFTQIQEENRALELVVRLGLKVLKIAATFIPPVTGLMALTWAWEVLREVWGFFRELQAPFGKESPPWRTGMLMAT